MVDILLGPKCVYYLTHSTGVNTAHECKSYSSIWVIYKYMTILLYNIKCDICTQHTYNFHKKIIKAINKYHRTCHITQHKMEIILSMGSANERWHYSVMSSLIGWAHTKNDPCKMETQLHTHVCSPQEPMLWHGSHMFSLKITFSWCESNWKIKLKISNFLCKYFTLTHSWHIPPLHMVTLKSISSCYIWEILFLSTSSGESLLICLVWACYLNPRDWLSLSRGS